MNRRGEANLLPGWLWRIGLWGLAVLIVVGVVGVLLLASGTADVPRAGPLQWEHRAVSSDCLNVDALVMPGLVAPFTIELSAQTIVDFEHMTWGVWLGTSDSVWRWEVVPPGYYNHRGQTFPFYHVGAGENELRLEMVGDQYTLRLNWEWANAGQIAFDGDHWGLVGGEGVCWRRVSVFSVATD